ncbi:PREDICTED: green-sensitive opsin P521-like [Amphimedon queenslandica]|uniref:G-protein coupled receptors family 1 profile domain-containing protein n=1 Tax=Amphimedon queenslandica TaxID=400682 RepID=A0A1X7VJ59_AMPQE|nr:PREDICTED: green-sensitive opsin P521-like [Amphimedon queenslandica]|eukprot:XP_019864482.1 PREDICTED: green-sensitive opsin P521-like [Amphimedon queenslandica]
MDLDSSFLDYANCSDQNDTTPLFINLTVVSNVVIAFHATFISLVIVTGLLANSTVLVLVAKDKRLRHRSIVVGLNIVFVDILLTIFYHGVILTNCLSKGWSYNEQPEPDLICRAYGVLTTVLLNIRWFGIAVLTTDRFLTVKFPFRYEKYSRRFLIVASLLTWTIPPGLASLLSLSLVSYSFRANIPTCLPSCINATYRMACALINTGIVMIMFIIGCIIPSGMYIWMYRKARKMRTKYTLGELALNVTTSVAVKNIRKAQNTRSQYDRQAMVTVFLIFLSILFTSSPSFLFLIVRQISICIFFKIPVVIHFIVTDIFIVSTALDPLVLMKNHDFRTVIYELFHKKCWCRHHVTDGRTSSTEAETQSSSANINDMHETNLKN